MNELVDLAVHAIIRPPRTRYDPSEIPKEWTVGEHTFIRQDLGVVNGRNLLMVGSLYHSSDCDPLECHKCVMFLHGNAGTQLCGRFLVPAICPYNVLVCCFDFCGCGMSGGEIVTLGRNEKQDVEYLMTELHRAYNITEFVLWGHSMGAATAVLVRHQYLRGIIADSCYTSIPDICVSFMRGFKLYDCVSRMVTWGFAALINQRSRFNIYDVKPIEAARVATIPALFGHALGDEIVPYALGMEVFRAYHCPEKTFKELEGDHNSPRSQEWVDAASSFIRDILNIRIQEPDLITI